VSLCLNARSIRRTSGKRCFIIAERVDSTEQRRTAAQPVWKQAGWQSLLWIGNFHFIVFIFTIFFCMSCCCLLCWFCVINDNKWLLLLHRYILQTVSLLFGNNKSAERNRLSCPKLTASVLGHNKGRTKSQKVAPDEVRASWSDCKRQTGVMHGRPQAGARGASAPAPEML